MLRMQEDEFDRREKTCTPAECKEHCFAKLYYLGTHSDYGCIHCGLKTLTPEIYIIEKSDSESS